MGRCLEFKRSDLPSHQRVRYSTCSTNMRSRLARHGLELLMAEHCTLEEVLVEFASQGLGRPLFLSMIRIAAPR